MSWIDNRLTWRNHIKKTCQASSSKIKKLFRMKSFAKTLQTVYLQGILPTVLCGIKLWGSLYVLSNELTTEFQTAARCFKLQNGKTSLTTANGVLHSNYHKTVPTQLYCQLNPKRGRATRNVYGVELPSFPYSRYKSSVTNRAAIAWNNLSNEVRGNQSKDTFKASLLKTDLLETN